MRKLYEIDQEIENLIASGIDPETGEWTLDDSAIEALQMEREQKIENVILYYKDLSADISKIDDEMKTLADRSGRLSKTREGLKIWLSKALAGKKFSTARCEASFRKSESVEVDDIFCEWAETFEQDQFINIRHSVTPNKTEIKKFLKSGGELPNCRIVEKYNISIK